MSCAVGLEVLEVVQDERLQERAREVGRALLGRLRSLADRHPLIGDVRGSGLFLGVELVRDRETLEPATAEATPEVAGTSDAAPAEAEATVTAEPEAVAARHRQSLPKVLVRR